MIFNLFPNVWQGFQGFDHTGVNKTDLIICQEYKTTEV